MVDTGKRYGFDTIFYLQPTVYNTKKRLTEWESGIVEYRRRRSPGWPDYNRDVYDEYRRLLPEDAREEGYLFIDADLAISAESRSVFADHVHLGSRGHQAVARHMHDILLPLVPCHRSQTSSPY